MELVPEADDRHYKKFGETLNKVDFGRKYEFKANNNPAPGQYEVEASAKATMTRSKAAKIVGSAGRGYTRTVEPSPEPGQYMS